MFERFTDRARRVVVLAQERARALGHDYIGTEHILLGLIEEGAGVAAKALEATGLSLDGIREEVEEIVGRSQDVSSGHIPFTSDAKKVIEVSLRESLQLGHNYIGTEQLLLGLIRVNRGVSADILSRHGVDLDTMRQRVIEIVRGYEDQSRPGLPPPAPTLAGTKYNAGEIIVILGSLLKSAQALVADRYDAMHPASSGNGGARIESIYRHLSVPSLHNGSCVNYAYELKEVVDALLTTGIDSLRRRIDLQLAVQQFVQDCIAALDNRLLDDGKSDSA